MRAAAVTAFACVIVTMPLFGAAPLFPTPLHITRQIHDPISGATVVLNEYAYGNRLVSVRGAVTAIADYERGELTEIDRDAGTYSITRFEAVAKATQPVGGVLVHKSRAPLRNVAPRATKSGRTAEFYESRIDTQSIEVGVDRSVRLSKEALEVLLGAAYPNVRRSDHEFILSAAGPIEQTYGLPVEQVFTYDMDGQQLEFRNSIIRVAHEPPPADLVAIPAGAQLVVSRIVAVNRELEQIDRPSLPLPPNP
jgi:hypothetical protein